MGQGEGGDHEGGGFGREERREKSHMELYVLSILAIAIVLSILLVAGLQQTLTQSKSTNSRNGLEKLHRKYM